MENVGVKDNYILVQRLKSAGCFIVCILLALICLVPLYIMIMNATHGDAALRSQPLQFLPGGDLMTNIKNIAGGEFPQSQCLAGLPELPDHCRLYHSSDRILLRTDLLWSDRLRFQDP